MVAAKAKEAVVVVGAVACWSRWSLCVCVAVCSLTTCRSAGVGWEQQLRGSDKALLDAYPDEIKAKSRTCVVAGERARQ